ncbi:hypothetical protein [Streptomyces sp. HC307]
MAEHGADVAMWTATEHVGHIHQAAEDLEELARSLANLRSLIWSRPLP